MGVREMKKLLAVSLALALSLSVLAGCSSSKEANIKESAGTNTSTTETNIAKMGIGHITSIAKSKDLGTDKDGNDVLPVGQVDTVIVAAAFDKDGKVVKVTIDNAQTKVEFNKDLTLKSDPNAEYKTKVELKEDYGMIKASSIKKEWYQQAEALGNWMVGKTIDEIKGMKTKAKDEAHPAVPDVPELTSSVTITVQDYIAALEEAYNNAVEVKGAETLGLGHIISIGKSKGLGTSADGKEVLPLAQVDTIMAATAFDKDGKVVHTIIDNAQTKVEFDNQGKVTTDKNGEFKTKVELKEDYGMIKASSIKKEWYQQAEALGNWMAGKTIDEIKGMKTKAKDEAHPAVPDVPELTSSVTISVEGYIAAVEEAFANAK
jgi:roadblock/LC7 domain-containing protein